MATAGTIRVTLTNKDPAKTADKGKRMPREVTCLGCGERLLEVDAVRIVGHNGYAIHCGTIRQEQYKCPACQAKWEERDKG